MRKTEGMFDGHFADPRCQEVIEDLEGPARRCVLDDGHDGQCVPAGIAEYVPGAMENVIDDEDERPVISTVDDLLSDILGDE